MELRMKNPIEALQTVGYVANVATSSTVSTFVSALQSITVNNIYLVLDSFQMQDSVLKRLNQVSAGPEGLTTTLPLPLPQGRWKRKCNKPERV